MFLIAKVIPSESGNVKENKGERIIAYPPECPCGNTFDWSEARGKVGQKAALTPRLLGLAGCEGRGFPARERTPEPVDTGMLDKAMARGGNIGNEQKWRCQDTEEDIPCAQGGREFSIADGKDSRIVTQHHAIDIRCQRKMIGMRAQDLAPTPTDRFQELVAMGGGADCVSSPQATKRMRVAAADDPNATPALAEALHQVGD